MRLVPAFATVFGLSAMLVSSAFGSEIPSWLHQTGDALAAKAVFTEFANHNPQGLFEGGVDRFTGGKCRLLIDLKEQSKDGERNSIAHVSVISHDARAAEFYFGPDLGLGGYRYSESTYAQVSQTFMGQPNQFTLKNIVVHPTWKEQVAITVTWDENYRVKRADVESSDSGEVNARIGCDFP